MSSETDRGDSLEKEPHLANTFETQNALRVKVAELCGWKVPDYNRFPHVPVWFWIVPGAKDYEFDEVPDYPNDLNACHEFEEMLLEQSKINDRETPFHAYFHHLHGLCTGGDAFEVPMKAEHWAICATAEQRCKAFVATMEGRSVVSGTGAEFGGIKRRDN